MTDGWSAALHDASELLMSLEGEIDQDIHELMISCFCMFDCDWTFEAVSCHVAVDVVETGFMNLFCVFTFPNCCSCL